MKRSIFVKCVNPLSLMTQTLQTPSEPATTNVTALSIRFLATDRKQRAQLISLISISISFALLCFFLLSFGPAFSQSVTTVPPTLKAALAFKVKPGEKLSVSSTDIAQVLPLPGTLAGEVFENLWIDNISIGIRLNSDQNHTMGIFESHSIPPRQHSDIVVSFEEKARGTAPSEESMTIPLNDPGPIALINNPNLRGYPNLMGGFAEMIQDEGRRLLLKGTVEIPIVDATNRVSGFLEYVFGENCSVVWDKAAGRYVWTNMTFKGKRDVNSSSH